jgi:hypothetical protein
VAKKKAAGMTVVKRVIDDVTAQNATEESAAKVAAEKVVEEAGAMRAAEAKVTKKALNGSFVPSSSPASTVRTKRATTPSSSTPPGKRFHGAWRPQYVE